MGTTANQKFLMADSFQPWSWLLETLADVKEADTALLKALVTRAPGFLNDPCYKNAKERVALRYLEERSDSMHADVTAAGKLAPRLAIDASKSSEDLLIRLSREVAASNDRRRHGTELLKHDVNQFVLQRRACLPKASLDKVKDLVLEGCHPSVLSLRERSGLAKENQGQFLCNRRISPETSNEFEAAKRLKLSTNNGELQSSKQNFVAQDPENRNASPQNDHAEKFGSQAFQHNFSVGESSRIEIDGDQITTNDGNIEAVKLTSPSMPLDTGDKMVQEASPECTVKTMRQSFQENIGVNEAAEAGYHAVSQETSSSSDELMANEALRFPSSRNPINQDSEPTGWSEQAFCVRCEEGGQLLVCNGNGCPLQVHESCLGSSAELDDKGKFYCPVCSYKRAAAAYRIAREKVRLARKALSNFMGRDMTKKKQTLPTRVHGPQEARISGDLNCSPEIDGGDLMTIRLEQPVKNNQNVTRTDARQQVEIPEDCNRVANRDHSGLPEARISGALNCSPEINGGDLMSRRPAEVIMNHQHLTGADAQQQVEIPADCNNSDLPCREADQSLTKNNHDVSPSSGITDKAEMCIPPDQRGPSHQPGVADGGNEHHFSRSSAKPRRPSKRYANPCFPYLRRTALPWTREEEEILKEAVSRFLSDGRTSHPWTQILEFGSHVFHKTRTPIDLKDKWRNLQKKQKSMNCGEG